MEKPAKCYYLIINHLLDLISRIGCLPEYAAILWVYILTSKINFILFILYPLLNYILSEGAKFASTQVTIQ